MNSIALLLMFGAVLSSCEYCSCNDPYHYHRIPLTYPQPNYLQYTSPRIVVPYTVQFNPMVGSNVQSEAHSKAQAFSSTPSCSNDVKQSKVFSRLFSLPGAVMDSLLSGEIAI